MLSVTERSYIQKSLEQGLRLDARGPREFRAFVLHPDILEGCYGSCLLQSGGSQIVVGIKAEVSDSPCAVEVAGVESQRLLMQGIQSRDIAVDDHRWWRIYVDISTAKENLFLCSIALHTALLFCHIPLLNTETDKVDSLVPLGFVSSLVFIVGWINDVVFFDVTDSERECLAWTGAVSICKGEITGMQTITGKVPPASLAQVVSAVVEEERTVMEVIRHQAGQHLPG